MSDRSVPFAQGERNAVTVPHGLTAIPPCACGCVLIVRLGDGIERCFRCGVPYGAYADGDVLGGSQPPG